MYHVQTRDMVAQRQPTQYLAPPAGYTGAGSLPCPLCGRPVPLEYGTDTHTSECCPSSCACSLPCVTCTYGDRDVWPCPCHWEPNKENPNALLDVVITRWWSWSWTPEVVVVGERREARHEAHPGARHDRHPCVRGVPTKNERRPSGGAEHHRRCMHAPSAIGIFHLPESRSSAGETATSHVQRLVGRIERD